MKDYLLLIKGKKQLDYSPEEIQKRIEAYRAWVATIGDKHIAGQRLERAGVHLRDKNTIATDGPFLEAKEIIAGYTIIKAQDLAQATEMAQTCPLLNDFEIFVRPMVMSD